MKSDNSFLKGTLILTVSSIVVKVIGALNWILLSRVLGHLPDGDHGFLGGHTGGDFHRDGGKGSQK